MWKWFEPQHIATSTLAPRWLISALWDPAFHWDTHGFSQEADLQAHCIPILHRPCPSIPSAHREHFREQSFPNALFTCILSCSTVMNDIISTMFNQKFKEELFKPQELYSKKALRTVYDRWLMPLSWDWTRPAWIRWAAASIPGLCFLWITTDWNPKRCAVVHTKDRHM